MSSPDYEICWLFRDRTEYYRDPVSLITASVPEEVFPALQMVESAAEAGHVVIGFVLYEAATAFDPALRTHPASPGLPLLWFAVFDSRTAAPGIPPASGTAPFHATWIPAFSRQMYEERFVRAREYIGQGDIYQVNLTFPLHASMTPDAFRTLFFAAAGQQVSDYRCYLRTPFLHIACLSPERFFSWDNGRVICRPMKGTAPRGRWPEEDCRQADQLLRSTKEQAENLMIVDLIRNDLGRVARTGTVDVPHLFTVERYQTLWQMTSTVTAETGETPLWKLFQALFPCGSVTGAPKIRAMEIIRELEIGPRGVYCGAIGRVGPGRRALFSVPIRTLTLDPGAGTAAYFTGSGVTWDAAPRGEYDECLLKTRVLFFPSEPFDLLETMRWNGRYFPLLSGHLQRLRGSAMYFGFSLPDLDAIREQLEAALRGHGPSRVRLICSAEGFVRWDIAELPRWPEPVALVPALHPVDERDPRLFHKTTRREVYRRALEQAPPGADDVLLWNTRGLVTETTSANVAVRWKRQWYTPPLEDGLLPGVMRRRLLETGFLREQHISVEALQTADEMLVFNSVRGLGRSVIRDLGGPAA